MRPFFLIPTLLLFSLNVRAQERGQFTHPSSPAKTLASLISPESKQGSSANAKDLSKVNERWAVAWNAKQLDQLTELYAPDAVFLTGRGDRITSRAAIRIAFKTALETSSSNLKVRSIVTEDSGGLAYDSGDYVETVTQAVNGAKLEVQGNYVIVFKRQPDGKWLIIEHVWTEAPAVTK